MFLFGKRYKYCINDNCEKKYTRHYHKNGEIHILRKNEKYCSICEDTYGSKYISFSYKSILNFTFASKTIKYYKHCNLCHNIYLETHKCDEKKPQKNPLIYDNYSPKN